MGQLIAVSPVLFENASYEPGDRLPTHNAEFVKLWTENGAAAWKDIEGQAGRKTKARQAAAPAGLPGDPCPPAGPGQDLVGKLPPREARGARPEPSKGRGKGNA